MSRSLTENQQIEYMEHLPTATKFCNKLIKMLKLQGLMERADCHQVACQILAQSLLLFDASRGVKFTTYLYKSIQTAFIDIIRANHALKRGFGWNRVGAFRLESRYRGVAVVDDMDELEALREKLPARLYRVAEMRWRRRMKMAEIAEEMKVTKQTVRVWLRKVKKQTPILLTLV